MDAALFAELQTQEEATDDVEAAENARLEAFAVNLHTHLPGIVEDYDAAKQTVSVRPAIMRVLRDRGPLELPILTDIPVQFPGARGYALTFPIAKGDECLLAFSERCIDFWYQNGGVQLPAEYRMHDLSDAFALMGVRSQPHVLEDVPADSIELRVPDNGGDYRINLGNGATHPLPLFDDYMADFEKLLADAAQACTQGAASCTGPASGAALGYSRLAAIFTALRTKLQGSVNHHYSKVSRTV